MTHRLYFVLPDVASARQLADDLLLARVEDRRMHFLAKRGTELGALHEASHFQKTDNCDADSEFALDDVRESHRAGEDSAHS